MSNTSATVALDYPVTRDDGTLISSLTFRRMKAKDAFVAEDEPNAARAGYKIFAALAGVDVAVIEDLDMDDIEKVSEAVTPLMGKSAMAAAKAAQPEPAPEAMPVTPGAT